MSRNKPFGLIFHSDRGTQYTSYEFRMLLKKHEIDQSFSAPGSPYDNAVAETFFGYLKKEEIYRTSYNTYEEIKVTIYNYINNYFNSYRPHRKLNNLTPIEFEEQYYEKIKKATR